MTRRSPWLFVLALACTAAKCGPAADARPRAGEPEEYLPPDQRDAHALGREVFDMVDRAVAYRTSHRGRPATTITQMGIESLTPATVRRVVNVQREPVVTVAFRRTDGREIVSCRGDSQVLVDAASNGGRFTLMCTTSSGAQRPMEVLYPPER
ncbi:MAG TPA: hypothetical protein VFS51_13630 [Gemmatimonadales bacterium]|nr:hypothetical protein [Gemmatimonadales bacterium]